MDSDEIWCRGLLCDKAKFNRLCWRSEAESWYYYFLKWFFTIEWECQSDIQYNISKGYGHIQTKLDGKVGFVTGMNWFDFGEDPDLGGGMRSSECPSCLVMWNTEMSCVNTGTLQLVCLRHHKIFKNWNWNPRFSICSHPRENIHAKKKKNFWQKLTTGSYFRYQCQTHVTEVHLFFFFFSTRHADSDFQADLSWQDDTCSDKCFIFGIHHTMERLHLQFNHGFHFFVKVR